MRQQTASRDAVCFFMPCCLHLGLSAADYRFRALKGAAALLAVGR
ncbi:MAG: hypothetical protein ACOC0D_08335 [Spirochaeta sp.]